MVWWSYCYHYSIVFHCDWPFGVPPAALFPLSRKRPQRVAEKIARSSSNGWDGEHALPGSSVGPRWDLKRFFAGVPVSHIKKKNMFFLFGRKTTRTLCWWSVEFLLSYNLSLAGQLQWIVPTKISPTKISSGYPPNMVGRSSTNYMQQNRFISWSNIVKV